MILRTEQSSRRRMLTQESETRILSRPNDPPMPCSPHPSILSQISGGSGKTNTYVRAHVSRSEGPIWLGLIGMGEVHARASVIAEPPAPDPLWKMIAGTDGPGPGASTRGWATLPYGLPRLPMVVKEQEKSGQNVMR